MTKPVVSIIVALLLPKYGIGYKGGLPWKLRQEMKYFKQVTSMTRNQNMENVVVMGHRTWDSIPKRFRPLPERVNVVLTRHDVSELQSEIDMESQGVYVFNSISDVIENITQISNSVENVFIIGGLQIYNECLKRDLVDNIYVTEIHTLGDIEMDTFLPLPIHNSNWVESDLKEELIAKGIDVELDVTEGDFQYQFKLYSRV